MEELGGRTPLEAAKTPHMDRLASEGEVGLVRTVPDGMDPGSDVANLSLLGYDPKECYTGRAPLEAASLGIELGDDDVALRCNLVALGGLSPLADGALMEDYSAGHIGSDEARIIIEDFRETDLYREHFAPDMELFPGVGYRHLLVWRGGIDGTKMTPPHDIIGKPVSGFLPAGDGSERLKELMGLASGYLLSHPVNERRRVEGKAGADSFWFWGGGRRPRMKTLRESTGLSGAVISAVDLVNGIGVLAGLERITVPGATGYVDSNFRGKAEYALEALARHDVVFVHMEAPDEAGHQGERDLKLLAIEKVDGDFLGPLLAGLPAIGDCRMLVSPDHPTPLATRTHTADMVPFIIWPAPAGGRTAAYHEKAAGETGLVVEEGHRLLERLMAKG